MSRVNSAAAVAWTMTIYDKSADDDCRRRLRCQRLTRWKLLQWRVCGLKCPARCRCCCCAGCGCCCCCWVGATAGATSPANWFCFLFTFFCCLFLLSLTLTLFVFCTRARLVCRLANFLAVCGLFVAAIVVVAIVIVCLAFFSRGNSSNRLPRLMCFLSSSNENEILTQSSA